METKPHYSYDEALKLMKRTTYEAGSVADLIERFVRERSQPGARGIGTSQSYTLRRIQRSPIAGKQPAALKALDFLEHCRARKAASIKPQTITHDMTGLSGVLKYAFEIWELPAAELGLSAYRKAIPQLKKEQLIAKSEARTRRPTQDELDRLLALFDLPPKKACKNFIPMVPIVKFSYLAGRRIGETCRITWGDIDHDKRICTVRDLKNSKGKGFHDAFPLLGEAWDIVMAQPRLTNDPAERIFPYNPKSVGAKYTRAKKELGIVNLRLHDNRRHCFSNLFEQGYSVPEVQKVSLHRNATILLKNYTALKPEDLHRGPAARRAAA